VGSLVGILSVFARGGPWFVRRPRTTIAVAAGMYVTIFAARLVFGDPADDVYLLFTLPVALLAVAFGLRAGVLAGLAGVALIAVWVNISGTGLSWIGWAARISPILLLGYLLGDAVDRLRRAEREQRRLKEAARRQRDAIEINDTIVQGLSAAKWALEAGDLPQGLSIVSDTLDLGHHLVSELIRDADMQQRWSGNGTGPDTGRTGAPSRARRQAS
jgi:hypothetical protein